MPAGRPQKADPFALYELARHFYGELKTIQEGLGWRIVIDRQKHEQLMKEAEVTLQLSAEALTQLERLLDLDIQRGFMPVSERSRFLDDMKKNIEFERRFGELNRAYELSKKPIPFRGEPETLDKLLNAKRSDQVRKICADAFAIFTEEAMPGEIVEVRRPNWPISQFSRLPDCLSQYASE